VDVSRSLITKLETGRLNPSYQVAKRIFEELDQLELERKNAEAYKGLSISDIHHSPVAIVEASETVLSVWGKMVDTSFSQFPVSRGGRIVGSVSERAINRAVISKDPAVVKGLPISELIEESFPILNLTTPVSVAIQLLQHYQAVLTAEEGNITGIVTNSDIGKILR
ncbi:CBS domain-containing protein, partial [Candidatus Bathyarchaeota archaeon]|nr:CBS domain-containing protein [Candidatus Bathyarchaeota archaeon]